MKTNYKKTHIRIFDATGLIFSASPDIDAYDLSRAVLDVIQKQNQTEPDFVRAMRQEYDNNFGSGYITFDRLLDNMRDDIAANGLESLYTIVKRLKDHDFTDEFINHYLDVNVPAVGIRCILEDLINAKMLLYAAGETRYADDEVDDADDGIIYTEAIDNQGVIIKVSHWQTNEKQIFTLTKNATFESVIENITILNESYEAEFERLGRAGTDNGIIKAKQCINCGSMDTIDAGSGAGCCNACGCWIPDYNTAKRLTGESQ